MIKSILGQKIGMSQIFNKEGKAIPVTVIKAGPCLVTQIRSKEKDGYDAVQLGFGKAKKLNKPQKGHLKKIKNSKLKIEDYTRWLREVRIKGDQKEELKIGDEITVDIFKEGDKVVVSGISKGKGFQGVIKRHGFSRGPASHGSDHHREPGSIGSMFPQRVVKGRKLPGRTGGQKVSIKNLEIVKVDKENNLLLIKGAVPGGKNNLLIIRGE